MFFEKNIRDYRTVTVETVKVGDEMGLLLAVELGRSVNPNRIHV